ncbi:hypothetical protein [Halorhabdus rudnickae]|uniref:hypothetical protein n=1 Tax=Halorhabdus rudnickae TaxID=1775544 RepID=UPI00108483D9|nr:hypothetical protein [Halorhabdus rudnickae]
MPSLQNASKTAGAITRFLAAETAGYGKLLVIWASISLALDAGVAGAVVVAVALAVMELRDRRPSLSSALAFLGVTVFLLPAAFGWVFVPGWSWLYLPARAAILVVSYMVAFHWGMLETGRWLRGALERVVKTRPRDGD